MAVMRRAAYRILLHQILQSTVTRYESVLLGWNRCISFIIFIA